MKLSLSVIALALTLPACDDGTTGIGLDFEPRTTAAALTLAQDFEVTRAEALVSELKLLPGKDDTAEGTNEKFKAKGTFFVNVLDPEDSTIPPIPLPAETYKKVEFKFDKPKDGQGLDGADVAVALDATIGDIAVELRLPKMDKVTLRHQDGIALATGKTSTFLVDLDIPSWFIGVDLATLDADDAGTVHIDDKTNKDAYDTVVKNIKENIKLVRKP